MAIGLSIVGYLVHEVGWHSIRETFGLLEWGYLVVLIYPVTWILFNTVGWRFALHAAYAKIPLGRMAGIRVAGETFNSLLPSGYVGGEPLKVKLLSNSVPGKEALASVLIAKAAQSMGLVLYVGLGLALGRVGGQSAPVERHTFVALGILFLGILLFTLLLAQRSFGRLGRWLHTMTGHPWLQKQESRLKELDDSIGAFYREGKVRFLSSVFWHLLGWLAGALEVALIFFLIGHSIDWRQAWFIGAMAQLASVIGLLVPAGIGLYEGGHYLAASLLGLPPELGLSVSLIRRVREIFWDAIGLFLFWKLSHSAVAPAIRKPGPSRQ